MKCAVAVVGGQGGRSLPVRGAWVEIINGGVDMDVTTSLPVRGAWVEINSPPQAAYPARSSLPVRGAWVEISTGTISNRRRPSLPVRGAWVEIVLAGGARDSSGVAPRAGSVG